MADVLLLETGDRLLLETGDGLLLEEAEVFDCPTWDAGNWRRTFSEGTPSRTWDAGNADRTFGG